MYASEVFLHIFLLTGIWLLTNSCTNRLEKQTISVANFLYECSKEESILIEAYKSATFFGSRQSLAQVRASLTYALRMLNKNLTRFVQFSLLAKKKGLCSQGVRGVTGVAKLLKQTFFSSRQKFLSKQAALFINGLFFSFIRYPAS